LSHVNWMANFFFFSFFYLFFKLNQKFKKKSIPHYEHGWLTEKHVTNVYF
jgi:hypothetical protein